MLGAAVLLLSLGRLGPARRGVLARETRPLVGELSALDSQRRGLPQGARQHRGRIAALQRPDFEVKRGNLLVDLSDHLRAGIDLIRSGHGHAALGIGGRGGDDGTKPRVEKGYSREVLRLPPAAALGPGGSLDEFWTRAAQHCDVVEVEIDGKLVYPF